METHDIKGEWMRVSPTWSVAEMVCHWNGLPPKRSVAEMAVAEMVVTETVCRRNVS
jgi:hypothetical protein